MSLILGAKGGLALREQAPIQHGPSFGLRARHGDELVSERLSSAGFWQDVGARAEPLPKECAELGVFRILDD